ncbi:MAG: 2,3-bisphosphoglycerate-independent phosphoglycerate mutase, partial [Firmicutes bacterium]|nr:2,3-bisphosphoglycerate-independent phosphoglycerate mutase [Bacillota bacterium]
MQEKQSPARTRLVLVLLDGWGLACCGEGNAITTARTPNWDRLWDQYPRTTLITSGEEVGLPPGQMGNSEVGHLNLGAGRVVYQELTRISRDIRNGSFFNNPVLVHTINGVRDQGKALHLMGLLSDGGVHSHIQHLFALLEMVKGLGVKRVYVHPFLDGRDVPPANALEYIDALEDKLQSLEIGAVATVMGRYYGMDRDKRWERTARAYKALVYSDGIPADSARDAVEKAYRREETDEFVQPSIIVRHGEPVAQIEEGDGVVFFNFRPDRARQITHSFVDRDFAGFNRGPEPPSVYFTCFTEYEKAIEAPVAFAPEKLTNTLGEVLSRHGVRQLRLAETEKYAHVTFFFNCGIEQPYPGEDRILIPSPQVATYDHRPEMSAREVTDTFLEKFGEYDVVIMNYANPDMVGHTGDLKATVKAVEVVDECLGRVIEAVLATGAVALVTADHGNAEMVRDGAGCVYTAHTCNPVPFLLVSAETRGVLLREGRLEDVAPTILEILGLPVPEGMTGRTLIESSSQDSKFRSQGWFRETGDRRQETGDRRQETGDRRQETGDRRQETGDRRQETG